MKILGFLIVGFVSALLFAAQPMEKTTMIKARVRYMVNELDPAVTFYTKYLGFRVEREVRPNFAMLS